jgi:hypothetical protein
MEITQQQPLNKGLEQQGGFDEETNLKACLEEIDAKHQQQQSSLQQTKNILVRRIRGYTYISQKQCLG